MSCGRVYRRITQDTVAEQIDRLVVADRDDWSCQLCLIPIDPKTRYPDPWSLSVDHIIPLSRGGDHTYANVQASHLWCNLSKGGKLSADAPDSVVV